MILLLLSSALAAPIVHEGGDPEALVASVAHRTGLPAEQLEAVALSEVLARPPLVLGDAVVRRCAKGQSTMADARAEIARAEAALTAGQPIAVADHLDLAITKLGCLSEVVDAPVAARTFLLRGGLAAEEGRLDDARDELRTALSLDPKVVWPTAFPVAGTPILAEVMEEQATHPVHILPTPTSGPWIDGHDLSRTGPTRLRGGLHLAQHSARSGLTTAWLLVRGEATWVLPDALPPSPLDAFAAGATGELPTVLVAAFPDDAAVYVAHQGGLWLATREGVRGAVTELTPPTPPEPEGKPKKPKKRR